MSHRLTAAAWIAIVATLGGVAAFAWFVSQIPFSTTEPGGAFGPAAGVFITAAMFFVPQLVIVFLFDVKNRSAQITAAVISGLAALAGILILAMWLTGAPLAAQSHDLKALELWAPLIVMGVLDGVAAVVAMLSPPPGRPEAIRPATT